MLCYIHTDRGQRDLLFRAPVDGFWDPEADDILTDDEELEETKYRAASPTKQKRKSV